MASVPTAPEAPGWYWKLKLCPVSSCQNRSIVRATRSLPPPAPNGTIIVICCSGNSAAAWTTLAPMSAAATPIVLISLDMSSPPIGLQSQLVSECRIKPDYSAEIPVGQLGHIDPILVKPRLPCGPILEHEDTNDGTTWATRGSGSFS